MPDTERKKQMRELIAGLDRQMADAEALLLKPMAPTEVRKIVDHITGLKVAKSNLTMALEDEDK